MLEHSPPAQPPGDIPPGIGEMAKLVMDSRLSAKERAELIARLAPTSELRLQLLSRLVLDIEDKHDLLDRMQIPHEEKYLHAKELALLERSMRIAIWELNRSLAHVGARDPLLGIYNRQGFSERCVRKLYSVQFGRETEPDRRASKGGVASVALFDIDHFKMINDQWGHAVGDQVLKQVSAFLESKARCSPEEIDLVLRYGGEEIVILYLGLSPEQAMARFRDPVTGSLVQRLSASVRFLDPQGQVNQTKIEVSLSAGIVRWDPNLDRDIWATIERADQLMYKAKQERLNRINIWIEGR